LAKGPRKERKGDISARQKRRHPPEKISIRHLGPGGREREGHATGEGTAASRSAVAPGWNKKGCFFGAIFKKKPQPILPGKPDTGFETEYRGTKPSPENREKKGNVENDSPNERGGKPGGTL